MESNNESVIKELTYLRDNIYSKCPDGKLNAWDLISLINSTIKDLDKIIAAFTPIKDNVSETPATKKEWQQSVLGKAYLEMETKLKRLEELETAALKLAASNFKDNVSDGWISCKDRLPEEDDFYIVYKPKDLDDDERVLMASWENGAFYFWVNVVMKNVTHWQPLPQKPKQ